MDVGSQRDAGRRVVALNVAATDATFDDVSSALFACAGAGCDSDVTMQDPATLWFDFTHETGSRDVRSASLPRRGF